jgi:hypothetical protein
MYVCVQSDLGASNTQVGVQPPGTDCMNCGCGWTIIMKEDQRVGPILLLYWRFVFVAVWDGGLTTKTTTSNHYGFGAQTFEGFSVSVTAR